MIRASRRHWLATALFGSWAARSRAATDAQAGAPVRQAVDASRLPMPGSYTLARVMTAPNGVVVDSDGRAGSLHEVLRGRLSVLSFMYTYCRDPQGCPLAWAALDTVGQALHRDAALAARSQLISISFDPTHDTPQQMRFFGGDRARDPDVRWRFLTTASVRALLPLLDAFGQGVTVETDAGGRATRTLNHMLKVFLIDAQLQVREIYGVATLDPQALLNDLRTLQLEGGRARP